MARLLPVLAVSATGGLVLGSWWFSPYTLSVMVSVLMFVALTSAWSIFSGHTRYLSFATVAFFGMGSYTTAVLGNRLPLPVVILLGGAIASVVALLSGLVVLRLKGPYFAVFTFGMAELTLHSVLWWEINVTGTIGRILKPVPTTTIYYYLLGIAAATVSLAFLLSRSRVGLALTSIGEDEGKAETLGINATYYKIVAFALSASIMGMVGAAIAPRWTYLDPHIAFNPLISFQVIIMALIGGARRVEGPVLGALLLSVVSEFLLVEFRYIYLIMLGSLVIAAVLFMPGGLSGELEKLARRWSRPHSRKNYGGAR
ncbi:MAG: branched-chain amino acid ABC transporter permease [Nitrospinota bacterium]